MLFVVIYRELRRSSCVHVDGSQEEQIKDDLSASQELIELTDSNQRRLSERCEALLYKIREYSCEYVS